MKKCAICGIEYEGCNRCEKTHGWKFWVHDRAEFPIILIFDEYRSGTLSKEKACERLKEQCGIVPESNLSWMLPEVERDVRELIGDKPTKATKKESKLKSFD